MAMLVLGRVQSLRPHFPNKKKIAAEILLKVPGFGMTSALRRPETQGIPTTAVHSIFLDKKSIHIHPSIPKFFSTPGIHHFEFLDPFGHLRCLIDNINFEETWGSCCLDVMLVVADGSMPWSLELSYPQLTTTPKTNMDTKNYVFIYFYFNVSTFKYGYFGYPC